VPLRAREIPQRSVLPGGPARARAARFAAAAAALLSAASGPARATEIEPDGTTVPQQPPSAEQSAAALLTPPSEVRLDRLVVAQHEMLESILDAHVALPGFSPLCDMTAQLLLRGGTCEVSLGWYNVVPGQTKPPTPDQVYPFLAANDPASMPRPDYTPGVPTSGAGGAGGSAGAVMSATIKAVRSDPHYAGGLVGFAMIGDDKKMPPVCTQTHFMEAALNPVCTTPACMNKPWIAGLSYQSTARPNTYYFLFEERPMSATDFGNDGDFNDQVFMVSGVTCDGGGQPCDTGKAGVCGRGTTQCGKAGKLTCAVTTAASPEVCDGLDNDCDGVVDPPGVACADPTKMCDRGRCVPACNDLTAPCAAGMVCITGVCRQPDCAAVTCPAGQVCSGGVCQNGCVRGVMDVVCPHGQVCRLGRCVDPCDGVTCPTDQICEDGVCQPPCTCRACASGKSCTRDGRCVDTGCQNTACPDDMTCIAGVCQDLCYLALCPTGQFCSKGQCLPMPPPSATGSGGIMGLPDAGFGGRVGAGGMSGSIDAGIDESPGGGGKISTCSCEAGGPGPGSLASLALVGVAVAMRSRRRSR